jgi:hypothetical protein
MTPKHMNPATVCSSGILNIIKFHEPQYAQCESSARRGFAGEEADL